MVAYTASTITSSWYPATKGRKSLSVAQADEALGKFLDYCTYGHMIDNVVLIVTGTLHERDVQVRGTCRFGIAIVPQWLFQVLMSATDCKLLQLKMSQARFASSAASLGLRKFKLQSTQLVHRCHSTWPTLAVRRPTLLYYIV